MTDWNEITGNNDLGWFSNDDPWSDVNVIWSLWNEWGALFDNNWTPITWENDTWSEI